MPDAQTQTDFPRMVDHFIPPRFFLPKYYLSSRERKIVEATIKSQHFKKYNTPPPSTVVLTDDDIELVALACNKIVHERKRKGVFAEDIDDKVKVEKHKKCRVVSETITVNRCGAPLPVEESPTKPLSSYNKVFTRDKSQNPSPPSSEERKRMANPSPSIEEDDEFNDVVTVDSGKTLPKKNQTSTENHVSKSLVKEFIDIEASEASEDEDEEMIDEDSDVDYVQNVDLEKYFNNVHKKRVINDSDEE